jgi:hypothetical protein
MSELADRIAAEWYSGETMDAHRAHLIRQGHDAVVLDSKIAEHRALLAALIDRHIDEPPPRSRL